MTRVSGLKTNTRFPWPGYLKFEDSSHFDWHLLVVSQRKGARKGKFLLWSTYICCRWQSHLSCCCWWWWWSDDDDTVLCWYLKSALSESSINWGTATLQRSSRPPVPWELLWHLASKTEELLDSESLQCETDSYGWDAWIISCKSIQ